MRHAIILILAVLSNTAAAGEEFDAAHRAELSDRLQRNCQSVTYAKILGDQAAAEGVTLPPEMKDASTLPLDKVRAAFRGQPIDRRVVMGCDCIMAGWRARAATLRTVAQVKQMTADMKSEPAQKSQARYDACVTKANAAFP